LDHIRTALRLELNNAKLSSKDFVEMVKWVKANVKGLFVPYDEGSFAREMKESKSDWDEDYFHMQVVYLKTNFSEKRLQHLIRVNEHLSKK